ncbi:MAG: hypothetical protein ABR584_07715 [Candidatus Baltobacteraceae bacterium]
MISGLGARVHLFVRPAYRSRFRELFDQILECEVRDLEFGLAYPILLVSFPDGSAFSVEFTGDAPAEPEHIDYFHAFRGAWIEFRTGGVADVLRRLEERGIPSFTHPASPHRYFTAPGGQVFRILDLDYKGP